MSENYMLTLENIKTFKKAGEIAKEKGHASIMTEDYMVAGMTITDTGLGRRLSRSGVIRSDVEKEIEQGSPFEDEISYNHPELRYTEANKYRNQIKEAPVLIEEEAASDLILEGLSLPLSENLKEALDYGNEIFEQEQRGEGIDTLFVLLGISKNVSSNAYRILFKLFVKTERISSIDENELFNQMHLYNFNSLYIDGIKRRNDAQKRAKSKSLRGENGILNNPYASVIDSVATDLVEQGRNGRLSPVIGRDAEIKSLAVVLCRNNKNNAVLLGKAGVGKTAIVEGLALKIAKKQAGPLNGFKIKAMSYSDFCGGLGVDLDMLDRVIQEMEQEPNNILFIDELHMLCSMRGFTERVKPALARGTFRIIGASTGAEWNESVNKNPALRRRFEEIQVSEPTIEQTTKIIKKSKASYENHFQMNYTDEVLNNVAALAKKYYPKKTLPDSAFTLLDNTGAFLAIDSRKFREGLDDFQKEQDDLDKRLKEASKKRYNEAEMERLLNEKKELAAKKTAGQKQSKRYRRKIRLNDVFDTIERETGTKAGLDAIVPNSVRLKRLPETLRKNVIGQEKAVETMSKAVIRAKYGLRNKNRPLGTYAFFGPTGVGKTEMAKVLADEAFNGNLIRIDMSEYSDKAAVSRLLGSAPGYIGFGETETLVDKIESQPESVVLFDEIEKAHPRVFDVFLQLFDEGRLTNGEGKTGDFTKSLIIMTSNLGFERKEPVMGFDTGDDDDRMAESISESVAGFFRPEFLNRIDEKIIFSSLKHDDVLKITNLQLEKEIDLIADTGIKARFAPEVAELIAGKYYDATNGARPIKRGLTIEVEDVLSQALVDEKVKIGDEVEFKVSGNSIWVEPLHQEEPAEIEPDFDNNDEADFY